MLFCEDVEQYNQVEEKYGATLPLLALETLSPNDTIGKVNRRIQEQLDFGVRNTLLYYRDLKATLDLTPGAGADPVVVDRLVRDVPGSAA